MRARGRPDDSQGLSDIKSRREGVFAEYNQNLYRFGGK
jgi:hypothetical protein